ncbi:unnamed protein product [Coffea canephora]|uniref:Cytochrome P450 n=1 Tax=Coffea canephora TaxID=49390 RepID=A0A068UWF1_COFCA|nr:unnamed protein product [Coffea canephora]
MKKYSPDIFKTKILGEKTAPEALARFLGKMDSISHQLLVDHWEGKEEVEAYPLVKIITLTLSCKFILGTDNPERIARLVSDFDDVTLGMHSIMLNVPGTIFYKANKAAAAIRKELLLVIKEKEAALATGEPLHDILSHMIVITDPSGKHMPEAEIADKMMGLIVAGYSTVATAITFMMKYVGERPDIYDKIRAEHMEIAASKKEGELLEWEDMHKMKYSWNVICETMRLNPPFQGTFREVLTDFTYAGLHHSKGLEEYARLAVLAFLHNMVKKYKWEVLFPDERVIGDMIPTPERGLPLRLYQL